ncbi:hypothetical protein [Pontibacter liquoris]|uniref:hypothetical protein n=1 Tax=Pontibacter liquoris TaxID=2905677 RepID=UPI001FA751F7|nr:hypothetical protein [Pontibacter liquoris]
MNNYREHTYGDYNRQYRNNEQDHPNSGPYQGRRNAYLGDTRHEPGEHYRIQQSRQYGRSGGEAGTREDRYNEMYDISNYSDNPRSMEYGQRHGAAENDLDRIDYFPYAEGPYGRAPRHYRYSEGYNPNYDNPEEGDMYRNFDSRGNHGYRHDASYGNEDEFRDFGNDHYGSRDQTNNNDRNFGYMGGYNR